MRVSISAVLALAGVMVALSGATASADFCEKQPVEATRTRSRTAVVKVATKSPAAFTESLKSFSIEFPDQVDPKSFTNRATLDIEILPNGTVGNVRLVKSTGVGEVDEQVKEGVRKWRFGKSKKKLFLYLSLVIEIR